MKQGLKENWKQFSLLVLINAFVGAMIGIERTIFPTLAHERFGLTSVTAGLSFIVSFGIAKAITNYFSGILSTKIGRKNTLLLGWVLALPIPILFLTANSWEIIVLTNILLGIHQGLAWSSTVVMKMDLVGVANRGLALGLNEFAGYISVAILAYFSTVWVAEYGIDFPFYVGIVIAVTGLLLSLFTVETSQLSIQETVTLSEKISELPIWKNKNLRTVIASGFVNNLNDGMVWGLLPIILIIKGLSITQIGTITSIYPAVWGISQLFTGKLSDIFCKKDLMSLGMFMQGIALLLFFPNNPIYYFVIGSILIGIGTAVVYPTFMASIAENTNPTTRPKILGIFRMFRDSGYAFGALISGILVDNFGLLAPIIFISLITIISGVSIKIEMYCLTIKQKRLKIA
ncbi:MAG: MFS transporter [Arcicella sp.]|nr:MFS transporter [Arcicella sp.]